MQGALAAFASKGVDQQTTIYLNQDWLSNVAETPEVTRILVEELGHSFDAFLNPDNDTPFDEGQKFASILSNEAWSGVDNYDQDHDTLELEGRQIEVELATYKFSKAYEVLKNRTEAGKESNTHDFDFNTALNAMDINDNTGSQYFSGNDLSVIGIEIGGSTYYGWISRPIKDQGVVRGFYFWSDNDFSSLALAQQDGNTDGDSDVTDNRGFILVVDQNYFNGLTTIATDGGQDIRNVGSSSDRSDAALNALLDANTVPTTTNDTANGSNGTTAAVEAGYNITTVNAAGNVLSNDTDPESDSLVVSKIGSGSGASTTSVTSSTPGVVNGKYGTLTIQADGGYSYVVNNSHSSVDALQNGETLTDSFTYTADDLRGGTASATLNIVINGSNDQPTASADYNNAKESTSIAGSGYDYSGYSASGNVLSNDSDVDDTLAERSIAGMQVSGAATVGTVNVTTGTTNLYFAGDNGFTANLNARALYVNISGVYHAVYDSDNTTQITLVSKTDQGNNNWLIALSATPKSYDTDGSAGGDAAITDIGSFFSSNPSVGFENSTTATENTSGMKTATVNTASTTGTTTLSNLSNISGTLTSGMSVTGAGVPAGTTISSVGYTNGVPSSIVLNKELTSTAGGDFTFSANATVGQVFSGAHGSLLLNADGSYTYTASADNPNLAGGESAIEVFDYTMQDSQSEQSSSKLYITVYGAGQNDPLPVVDSGTATETGVTAGSNASGNVLSNDLEKHGASDAGTNSVSEFSLPGGASTAAGNSLVASYGSLTIASNGSYSYTLDNNNATVNALAPGETLSEEFTYKVANTLSSSTPTWSTLTITINGANDAPVATNDSASVQEDSAIQPSGDVLANDSDVDNGDALHVANTIAGTSGGFGAGNAVTAGTTSANGLSVSGSYGSLTIGADGTYVYALNNNHADVQALTPSSQALEDVFTYNLSDSHGGTTSATLTISISGANEPPVNSYSSTISTSKNVAVSFSGGNTISVADGDNNLSWVNLAVDHGTLNLSLSGAANISAGALGSSSIKVSGNQTDINNSLASLSYTPENNYTGSDYLTLMSQDALYSNDSDSITISINSDSTAPVITANQSFNYAENQAANAVVATVAASDAVGVTGFRFAANQSATSADGFYTINSSGQVAITTAGVAAGIAQNDYETGVNQFTYAVQAGDAAGNWSTSTDITLNVTDVDDTAPLVTANQSFNYAENQSANAVVATVAASDAVGVTGFRFAANQSATSADGYYTINSSGQMAITAAGVAAGIAQNDYETGVNQFSYAVQAGDAAGNWSTSTDITLNITDVDDTAPAISASQSFNYAENQSANATVATVAASDGVEVTTFRFADNQNSTSSDGFYTINNNGQVAITAAGVAAGIAQNDYETGANQFTYAVQAGDASGNWSSSTDITLNVTDVDDTAPEMTTNQSFNYAENQSADAVVATVVASDAVGVTGFRFADNQSSTSSDGYYTINSSGQVAITTAGIAAGIAQNDYETGVNQFSYAVQAGDAAGNWSTSTDITLNVTDVDDTAPEMTTNQSFNYAENQSADAVVATVAASDGVGVTGFRFAANQSTTSADGFYTINSSGQVSITAAGIAAGIAQNDYETGVNQFTYAVQAGDASGNWSSSTDITLNVTDVDDTAPEMTTNQSFNYAENQAADAVVATVVASDAVGVTGFRFADNQSSTSSDGYYTINSSGQVSITAAGIAAGIAQNDYETGVNQFTYAVQAGDAVGNWSTSTDIKLNITDVDDTAPVVTTNQSFNYAENQSADAVVATVAASDAVGVTGFRFADNQSSTSSDGYYTINSSGQVSITAAGIAAGIAQNDYETGANQFTYAVQAGDAAGNWSSSTDITLNVTDVDDTAPAISASQSFNYAENQAADAVVATVVASDAVGVTGFRFADNQSSTSSDGYYTINSSGQVVITTAGIAAGIAQNDYETGVNQFTYAVQAGDAVGNWSTSTDIKLNITDVDDTAPAISASQSFNYAENQTANATVATVAASDTAGVTAFRFADNQSSTSSDGYYTINSSGQVAITTAGVAAGIAQNDYETGVNQFTYAVQAGDAAGNWSTSTDITLNVTDVDDTAPVITANQSFNYAENQSANATVATVAASDAVGVTGFRFAANQSATSADGFYTINSNGQVAITAAGVAAGIAQNDYETGVNQFTYAVQAGDAVGNWSSSTDITLNVTDVDDTAPAISASQSFNYAENQSANAVVATVVASDTVGVTGFRFADNQSSTSSDGYYTINSSGQVAITTAGVAAGIAQNDYETGVNQFSYAVQAGDAAGNWSTSTDITLNVTDVDDTAPAISASQSFNYAENQTANATVATVAASDTAGVTAFRFADNQNSTSSDGYYTINSSGQVSITTAGVAAGIAQNDYETGANQFTYAVQAGDASGNWSSSTDITLNVTDVDDTAPVITANQSFNYAENQSANATVATVAASDAVGVTGFRFAANQSATSADGFYTINSNGQVAITAAGVAAGIAQNDYETGVNQFTYAVQAGDAAGNWSTSTDITLNVTDVDDTAPAISASQSFNYAENQSANATVATVAASDGVGVTTFRFADNQSSTSSDGYYTINSSGQVAITTAGVAAGIAQNDYETGVNQFSYAVQAGDAAGNWSTSTDITLNITDVDDTAPVVTTNQSFNYAENQAADAVVATVVASDAVGVTGFRFADNQSSTSSDGYYTINSSGQVVITAASVAAGIAQNDYETGANQFTYAVQAGDAAGNWSSSADITLNVTDVDDTAPVVTTNQSFNYAENQSADAVVAAVAASDAVGVTGFRFADNQSATSADGFYTINSSGQVAITAAGIAAGIAQNDYETGVNQFSYAVQAGDAAGNWSTSTDLKLNITDVDDTAPVVSTNQSFNYAENQSADAVVAAVAASDAIGVTAFRFAANQSATSADGYYTINSSGQVAITTAGIAAGIAQNDYETGVNQFTYAVQAGDASGNWSSSTDLKLNITDVDDTAPVVTTNQSFNYAENQSADAVVATVAASDAIGVTAFRFAANQSATSADGYYTINRSGQVSITAAGVAAGIAQNDYETGTNQFSYAVQAGDAAGNWSAGTDIGLNISDIDEIALLPEININRLELNEAAGEAVFEITRSGDPTSAIQVDFATADGSATAGSDYAHIQGKLDFAAGETIKQLAVPIYNDALFEQSEDFSLQLSHPVSARLGEAQGIATLYDDGRGNGGVDDDRPLSISSQQVNEASPFAVFTVSGTSGQRIVLQLAAQSADGQGVDFGSRDSNNLQVSLDNGQNWQDYSQALILPDSGQLLARTAVIDDSIPDNGETFMLTGTPLGGHAASGVATLNDQGQGHIFNPDGSEDQQQIANDDRVVQVSSPLVNEASPYAVFTVSGAAEQLLTLSLSAIDSTDEGVDFGRADGSGLQVSLDNGQSWIDYHTQVALPSEGRMLVRTPLVDDNISDNGERFSLTVTPAGGLAAQGIATLNDQGAGSIFNTDGSINRLIDASDDRQISINSPTVNEASPFAIFTINGFSGQTLALQLDEQTASNNGIDFGAGNGSGLEFSHDNGQNWHVYLEPVALSEQGILLVRTPVVDDNVQDNGETFSLTARVIGGHSAQGLATINDQGGGSIFRPDGSNNLEAIATIDVPPVIEEPVATPAPVVAEPSLPPAPAPTVIPPVVAPPVQESAPQMRENSLVSSLAEATELLPPTAMDSLDFGSESEGNSFELLVAEQPSAKILESGQRVSFSVSQNTFRTTDPDTQLEISATRADGSPLPDWVSFDPSDMSFSGTPPEGVQGSLDIRLNAKDEHGNNAATQFSMQISRKADSTSSFTDSGPENSAVTPAAATPVPSSVDTAGNNGTFTNGGTTASAPSMFMPASSGLIVIRSEFSGTSELDGLGVALTVNNQQTSLGEAFLFQLPDGLFEHSDANAQIRIQARLADGQPLPDWLVFNPESGRFSGTIPLDAEQQYDIEITASGSNGEEVSAEFRLLVNEQEELEQPIDEPAIQEDQGEAGQQGAQKIILPSRPGLNEQLQQFGQAAFQKEQQTLLQNIQQLANNQPNQQKS